MQPQKEFQKWPIDNAKVIDAACESCIKRAGTRKGIRCTTSHSMFKLPKKSLFVKLHYQNGKCATEALRSCRHEKGIRTNKGPMTSSAVKKMISKFEATPWVV